MRGKPGTGGGPAAKRPGQRKRYGYQPAFHVTRAQHISKDKLAEVTGYSPSMVTLVLRGARRPSKQFVERMSEFLRLPPEVLFTEEVRP